MPANNMLPAKKTQIILFCLIIAALAIRLAAVFKYGNFWSDEMFSFVYSQKPWPESLKLWFWETNPPLHLMVLKIWFFIFPTTEFFARLPGVLAGSAAVFFIYKLGRQIFNEKTGLIAAAYLAFHPYHIFWSATARTYSILMLLAIISVYYFYRIYFADNVSKQTRIISGVINFLLALSHLSASFLFLGQAVALGAARGRREFWKFIKNNLLPLGIAYLYVAISLISKAGNGLPSAWFLNLKINFINIIRPLINIFIGQANYALGTILLIGIIILIIIATRRAITKLNTDNDVKKYIVLLSLAIIPVILCAAFGVWNIKFFVITLPFFVLILSFVLDKTFGTALAIFGISAICFIGLVKLNASLPITDWQPVKNYLDKNYTSSATIIIYNDFMQKPQIDRYLPTYAATTIPFTVYPDMNWDEMTVKKNYLYSFANDKEKNTWYQNNKLNSYEKIILLQGEADNLNKLTVLMDANGWKLSDKPVNAPLGGLYNLYMYEKR